MKLSLQDISKDSSSYAIALCCATLLASGCGEKKVEGQGTGPQATPVQVQVVESQEITNSTEYLSILKSRHSANINPQVEGYVTNIYVKSGDRVAAGTPILQIDPLKQQATMESQEAQRVAQEANVSLAKINLDRTLKLYEAKVISRADLDTAQNAYDTAVAQLKALERQVQTQSVELHYYKVTAPMSGIIGDIPVRVGDRVVVGTLLTTVDEPGALEAYIYVPASRARDLRIGLPVKLLEDSGKVGAVTRISFVSPQADQETQTVLAKALVENPQTSLRISQQVRAQVDWSIRQGATIPILSVQRINGEYFVFVAANEGKGFVARQRVVKIGEVVGNDYAVLDGIKPGDHLIISGTQFLQDGAPVQEQTKGKNGDGEAKSDVKTK
ncbi:MAG TPA: efflux RND transporter periplasmic adaptor subunit [Candidatus Acidoferrum sp.]|jgi:RND family efflux transporter MFP subunit